MVTQKTTRLYATIVDAQEIRPAPPRPIVDDDERTTYEYNVTYKIANRTYRGRKVSRTVSYQKYLSAYERLREGPNRLEEMVFAVNIDDRGERTLQ